MRVALLQVGYDGQDGPARIDRVAELVRAQRDADLVVLPELWAVGAFRPGRWAERAEGVDGPTVAAIAAAAADAGAVVHAGTIIEATPDGRRYNTAVVVGPDGAVLATYRKIHRFGAAGRERDLIAPGSQTVVADVALRAGGSVRVGLATCYDLRFPELFRALTRDEAGGRAQLLLVSASWPASRASAWEPLLRARAIENQAVVLGSGAAGTDGSTPMAGGSVVVGPLGDVLARAGTGEECLVHDLDLDDVEAVRADFPVLPDRVLP